PFILYQLYPPTQKLFPYTTLFRSGVELRLQRAHRHVPPVGRGVGVVERRPAIQHVGAPPVLPAARGAQPVEERREHRRPVDHGQDRKSTRLNSSHDQISYAVSCLK